MKIKLDENLPATLVGILARLVNIFCDTSVLLAAAKAGKSSESDKSRVFHLYPCMTTKPS